MKLLSPAGNFECLKSAIYNGADEVYLGINEFNARNNIDGFTIDTLCEAVDFAHVFGVKVHLAINILFSDSELNLALSTAIKAYNIGVDALIIQDLGLAYLLEQYYPEIEKHASTQMGIHNLEGVKAIERFGFKRVVLSRETPLDEIKRIKKGTDMEIEYFAHGALCVSFSGNCYLSSYALSASGNRGRCKQLCRLPYTLYKGDKKLKKGYLLSAKDFNMINRLKDLESAGVSAIKIEGRARRAYYVGAVTNEYRRALDGKKPNLDNLDLAFNRNFTEGYFNGNGNVMSDVQSHIGVEVGTVYKVNNGKNFNQVYFTSNRILYPKSSFKTFERGEEKAVITAYDLKESSIGKYVLTTTQRVGVGESVRLITDSNEEEKLAKNIKKRAVNIEVVLEPDRPIIAQFKVGKKNIVIEGDTLQTALNQPLAREEIMSNFSKSEYFDARLTVVEKGKTFMRKQSLNHFRRKVLGEIYRELTAPYKRELKEIKLLSSESVSAFKNYCFVENIDGEFSEKNVIYSPEVYQKDDVFRFKKKCDDMNKCAYLDLPNFALKKDVALIKEIIADTKVGVVANNYYALSLTCDTVIGGGLNVYNRVSASVLGKPFITAEAELGSRIDFAFMTLRHCPMKAHLGANCSKCPFEEGYEIKTESGKVMKLKRKKLSDCTFYLTD